MVTVPNKIPNEHAIITCLKLQYDCGIDYDFLDLLNNKSIQCRESAKDIHQIAEQFKCRIIVYTTFYEPKFSYFKKENDFNYGSKEIGLITISNSWGFLKKNKRLCRYKLLDHYLCHNCQRWSAATTRQEFIHKHLDLCRRCHCLTVYKFGDSHAITCTKPIKNISQFYTKKKKGDTLVIKQPKPDKEALYIQNNHHADLECFPDERGSYITYAAGLSITRIKKRSETYNEEVIFFGENTMKDFVEKLETISGVLWFFNGGKFDLFFLLEYLIRNNIPIDLEGTLLEKKRVHVLSLYTKDKKKRLIIKDLSRFLPGSLDFNCKSLGIQEDQSKTDFDHGKINSWQTAYLHRIELESYLLQDIRAQRACYEAIAKQSFDDYSLNLSKFVSLAQFAFTAFSLSVPHGLLYKVPKSPPSIEQHLREAYRGGRLVLTYPEWYSSCYETLLMNKSDSNVLESIYHTNEDYLVYLDKNSLYPSVMYAEKYPCGKMTYNGYSNTKSFKVIQEMMNDRYNDNSIHKYKLYMVDIICPKDLYIPFLMSRDEKGKNIQDLEDKIKVWYAGPEIMESLLLGYKIMRIYADYTWSKVEYLFKSFVQTANDRKTEAARQGKKNSAQYLGPKNEMNSLSGKFAQKTPETNYKLLIGNTMKYEQIIRQSSIALWDINNDDILACVAEEKVENEASSFPIQLSVFILSNSKVSMSRFLRLTGGYRIAENCPIYGDTDSLIVPKKSILNVSKEEFGGLLGQMKDEMPNDRFIAIIVIAPKTYMKLFIKPIPYGTQNPEERKPKDGEFYLNITNSMLYGPSYGGNWGRKSIESIYNIKGDVAYMLFTSMTSKGIPHTSDEYPAFGNYLVSIEKQQEAMDIYKFLVNRENTKIHYKKVELKERLYLRIHNNSTEVKSRITWEDMLLVSKREAQIVCLYGGMIRNLCSSPNIEDVGVSLDYMQRSLTVENWWKKGNRNIVEIVNNRNQITVPIGFNHLLM